MKPTTRLTRDLPIVNLSSLRPLSALHPPRHQLLLSLSPGGAQLLHMQRTLIGWRTVREECVALADTDDFLTELQQWLQRRVQAWGVGTGSRIHWVLAGDILGVAPPVDEQDSATSALPFSPADIRTQPDTWAGANGASLMWIHKDWLAQFERISSQSGLQLAELFARAQLFQPPTNAMGGPCKVIVEQQGTAQFLHIFDRNAMMLRTRVLQSDDSARLQRVIAAELAALGHPVAATAADTSVQAPAALLTGTPWPGLQCSALQQPDHAALLQQLWRGRQEGIVVRTNHEAVVRTITHWSLGLGVAGLLGIAAMFWHDGKLEQRIEQASRQLRKMEPSVREAKALKQRTLVMADALQQAQALGERTALAGFGQVLLHFPPPPATLLYLRADGNSVALAATGDDTSAQWLRQAQLPGFEPLVDWPLPPALQDAAPPIHLQAQRAPAASAPTTPTAETQP